MFKKIFIVVLVLLIGAGIVAYQKYQEIFTANVPEKLENPYLLIPTGSTFEEILDLLEKENFLIDVPSFVWLAEQMNYKKAKMRTGRYKIQGGWNNRQLIRHLRGGQQATVKVVLHNERLIEDIAGKVAQSIEADSIVILQLLSDEAFLESKGYTKENLLSLLIPNTYDFFWNTTPLQFFERMQKEHDTFWSRKNRRKKAADRDMSPEEVYTLASILERESNKKEERPRIAGVYLNRLKRGILLQADPTVVFATKEFGLRRVLNRHLEFDSPYNTYLYVGLPPGPIGMTSINSIDAVLDAEDHDYIFFCAKPGQFGYHNFAKTLAGHNANARKYHRWLDQQGIR